MGLVIFIRYDLCFAIHNVSLSSSIAGELFPTRIRGRGAGFAVSFAKIGALLTAFLFPILAKGPWHTKIIGGRVVASLIGAIVTYLFRIETASKNLEEMD